MIAHPQRFDSELLRSKLLRSFNLPATTVRSIVDTVKISEQVEKTKKAWERIRTLELPLLDMQLLIPVHHEKMFAHAVRLYHAETTHFPELQDTGLAIWSRINDNITYRYFGDWMLKFLSSAINSKIWNSDEYPKSCLVSLMPIQTCPVVECNSSVLTYCRVKLHYKKFRYVMNEFDVTIMNTTDIKWFEASIMGSGSTVTQTRGYDMHRYMAGVPLMFFKYLEPQIYNKQKEIGDWYYFQSAVYSTLGYLFAIAQYSLAVEQVREHRLPHPYIRDHIMSWLPKCHRKPPNPPMTSLLIDDPALPSFLGKDPGPGKFNPRDVHLARAAAKWVTSWIDQNSASASAETSNEGDE